MTDHFTGNAARVKDAAANDAIRAPHGPIDCGDKATAKNERDVLYARQLLLEEMLQYAKRNAYQFKAHVDGLDRGMVGDQAGVEIALETFRVWQAMVCRTCPLEET